MQLNNIKVPESQVVYGSIDYQNEFVDDNLVAKNPKYYLTRMLNIILSSAISYSDFTCNSSKNSIISGLDIKLENIIITNNETLSIGISPGILISDNTIINIKDTFWLDLDLIFLDNLLIHDKFVIYCSYDFKSRNPIKFSISYYDADLEQLVGIDNITDDTCFIYRYLSINYAHNKVSIEPILEKTIKIDGLEYNAKLNNCYAVDYISKLEDYFGITYFLDLPYVPPDPRSPVFGVTKMFLN